MLTQVTRLVFPSPVIRGGSQEKRPLGRRLRDNLERNESWLANEHMRKFIGWFRDRISQSSDTQTSEYLKKLSREPILTVVKYQGYDINGYMFYTKQQDKKSKYQNSGVRVDAYDATGQDKNMYCGQIQEI
jgi:hypothetical protein